MARKNSLLPEQLTARPFLKTLVISILRFKCSCRLNLPPLCSSGKRGRPGFLIGFLFVCNGKFVPPLCPAALQYKPPSLGLHTRPKAKFSVPFNLTGLISPLHGNNSSINRVILKLQFQNNFLDKTTKYGVFCKTCERTSRVFSHVHSGNRRP